MNARLRLGAIVMLLFAFLLPNQALADDKAGTTATITEKPSAPDPYTVDDPNGSTANNEVTNVSVSVTDGATTTTTNNTTKAGVAAKGTPSFSGCKEISGKVTGKNVLGNTLWTFKQTATWCWKAGANNYWYSDYTVTTPGQWWQCLASNCLVSSSNSGKVTPWIRYRQAGYGECFPSWLGGGCYHKSYPWVKMYMYGNGTYTISWSS